MIKHLERTPQRLSLRDWSPWLILLFVAFVAVSCQRSTPVAATRITYAMPITVTAVLPYVALEKGFWRNEGLDVNAQMFSAGRLALDALLAKNAEVMSVSETPLVHAILQGNRVFIVATVAEHREVKFIGRRDRHIENPEDLRGKVVATLPGTNSDYFMYELFKKYGISTREVKIANMAPPEMVTAFVSGTIDGYFAWEPHIYYGARQLPGRTIVFGADDLYRGWHTVAMNQDFVRAHPEVVRKLVRGFIKAEDFVEHNPGEAMAIVSRITGVDKQGINGMWPEIKPRVRLDADLIAVMRNESRWAQSLSGSYAQAPNWRAFIYDNALSDERASSVNLSK